MKVVLLGDTRSNTDKCDLLNAVLVVDGLGWHSEYSECMSFVVHMMKWLTC